MACENYFSANKTDSDIFEKNNYIKYNVSVR